MSNPKVATLTDADFRLWVKMLSVAAENDGDIPHVEALAAVIKMRLDYLSRGVERLLKARLIDLKGPFNGPLNTPLRPHSWDKFQYKSDTSTPRVTLHRAKRETAPETDTDTDNTLSNERVARTPAKRAVRCPDDWQPTALGEPLESQCQAMPCGWMERQLANMRDWSRSSPKGAKLNWDATWRSWLRRELEKVDGRNGKTSYAGKPEGDAAQRAFVRQLEQIGMGGTNRVQPEFDSLDVAGHRQRYLGSV